MKWWNRIPPRYKYIAFRTLAFIAAVAFPAAAAIETFGAVRKVEAATVEIQEGYVIGLGAIIALAAFALVFYKQVIATMKKYMGLPMVVAPAIVWVIMFGLEKAADLIPGLKVVAFWWTVGGLAGWGLTALGCVVSGIKLPEKKEDKNNGGADITADAGEPEAEGN